MKLKAMLLRLCFFLGAGCGGVAGGGGGGVGGGWGGGGVGCSWSLELNDA